MGASAVCVLNCSRVVGFRKENGNTDLSSPK